MRSAAARPLPRLCVALALIALAATASAQEDAVSATEVATPEAVEAPPVAAVEAGPVALPVAAPRSDVSWALRLNVASVAGQYGLEGAVNLGPVELALNLGGRLGIAAGWRHESGFLVRLGASIPSPAGGRLASPLLATSSGATVDVVTAGTLGWEWRIDHWSVATGVGAGFWTEDRLGGPGTDYSYTPIIDLRAGWLF